MDNSIVAFASQLSNGVYVPSYFGQSEDNTLLYLIKFLTSISDTENIPAELERRLGLETLYYWYIDKLDNKDSSVSSPPA